MMEQLEVLAPAGGWESLEAAVFAGADAVYLGGPAFGARANAKNFTREELARAAAFCHGRGVRLHVTVNTLLKDQELPQALEFVAFLCSLPVDAVLVQDVGLFSLLRQRAPGLPLHCSTQMSLHTPAGVRLLFELGARRAVLAREMSLSEMEEVRGACPIELEAFVHGALCMCVSGQCYLSAMLGGRSGNRGMCAQPCRLPFAAPGGTGHDLSLKDLSLLEEARQLGAAGICSLKIEGRMKRPEYVAAAVSACRHAVDQGAIPAQLAQDLEAVFSRSGFTKGYLTGKRGAAMFGVRRKEDVTQATEKVFAQLRGLYRGERQNVPITLELGEEGDRAVLLARDREGREARASAPLEAAGRPPLPRERCLQQLHKTGGTPFLVEAAAAPAEGARLAVSALNALRREALLALLAQRERREPVPFAAKAMDTAPHPRPGWERLPVRACFRSPDQMPPQARRCREIALPLTTPVKDLERLGEEGWPPHPAGAAPGHVRGGGAHPRPDGGAHGRGLYGFHLREPGGRGPLPGAGGPGPRHLLPEHRQHPGPGLFPGAGVTVGGVLLRAHRPGAGGPGWQPAPGGHGLRPPGADAHPQLPFGQLPQGLPGVQVPRLPHRPEA